MAKRTELRVASGLKFKTQEEENLPPQISGYAIHPGLFNEIVEVPVDELHNLEESLRTAQLRYDHGHSVFNVIGKVNEAEKTFDAQSGKEGVYYKAEIDDQDEQGAKVLRKIERGYVDATSIGFYHDSICSKCGEDFYSCSHWFDEAHVIAKNCEVFELSVVALGADGDATATVAGLNKEFVSKFKKQFGGKGMEPKETQKQPVELGSVFEKVSSLQETNLKKDQKISELEGKLDELDQLKADFEQFKTQSQDALKEKDDKIDALKSERDEATKGLDSVTKAQRKVLAEDLVDRQIALDLLDKESRDSEIESLAESGDLDALETFVKRAETKAEKLDKQNKTPGEGKVPKVQNLNKEKKEVDYNNLSKEQEQQFIHSIFGYDHVFEGSMDEGVVPGHTYVGLFSNKRR